MSQAQSYGFGSPGVFPSTHSNAVGASSPVPERSGMLTRTTQIHLIPSESPRPFKARARLLLLIMLGFLAPSLGFSSRKERKPINKPNRTQSSRAVPRQLADIPSPWLDMQMGAGDGTTFLVGISSAGNPVTRSHTRQVPAEEAKAWLNGIALARLTGEYKGGDLSYNHNAFVEFVFPPIKVFRLDRGDHATVGSHVPQSAIVGERALFRVQDRSALWQWEVPNAFTMRDALFILPVDGSLVRGQRVVLQWVPKNDHLNDRS